MTEAEVLELMALYVSNAVAPFNIYLTVTFAYLSVSYLIGKKLSSAQVLAVSCLYITAATASALTSFLCIQTWGALQAQLPADSTLLNEIWLWNAPLWLFCLSVLYFMGVAVSLYFMYERHCGVRSPAVK